MLGKNSDLYKTWKRDWKRYETIPMELEVANFGSTCDANNFDYSYWDRIGFNFASGPQDMYYDNQLLEQYGKHLKKGATVFISISEFAFLVNKYETDYHNYKYYGYVEPQRILNYSNRKAWMIKHCPGLLDNRQMKQEIKSFIKRILKLKRNALEASLEARSKQTMANWLHEFGWDDEVKLTDEQRRTLSRSWDIFLKDIEFCDKNGLIPVVVVPPFNIHLKKIMPYNVLDECLWDHIELIKKKGIKVVNFWDDKELEDERYYSTPICLNEMGKDMFNRRLQEEIYGRNDDSMKELPICPERTECQLERGEAILCNGISMPCIAFGTGVVKRFYRNRAMYIKDTIVALLRSVKHRKMVRFLKNDMTIRKTLDTAIQCGYRMFDSGRLYGHSEKYIGEIVGKYDREDFFIITKVSDVDLIRYPNASTVHDNLSISLKFLNTDYADAYLLHFPSGDWVSMYKEIEKEYKAGKVRAIGVCNFDADEMGSLLEICEIKPMICQVELHPLNTKRELRKLCSDNGIVVMAHTPTAHMSNKVTESEIMTGLIRKYDKSAAQIIYRWHYQNSVIPIVSSVSEKHLRENLDIFDFSLADDEMERIEELNMNYSFDKNNNKTNDCPGFIYNL